MAIDVEQLYRRYGGMVYRRCQRLLRDEAQAEEAMHDVFVQLLRYESRLEASACSALLYQMATRVCLNHLRTRRRRPETPDEALLLRIASVEGLEDRSLARAMLERILGLEPLSTQTMAVLHLVDGMTLEEVARESGMSVSGVRKRLRQFKSRLQAQEGVLA